MSTSTEITAFSTCNNSIFQAVFFTSELNFSNVIVQKVKVSIFKEIVAR